MTAPGHARLEPPERRFIAERRTATLATVAADGRPRLVPICFVLSDPGPEAAAPLLYSPLDEKPKRGDVRSLARVRDILERPEVALLFERWSEHWSDLAWLRARGVASLVEPGDAAGVHRRAVEALRMKYPQYRAQAIELAPMIQVELLEHISWSATADGMAG